MFGAVSLPDKKFKSVVLPDPKKKKKKKINK